MAHPMPDPYALTKLLILYMVLGMGALGVLTAMRFSDSSAARRFVAPIYKHLPPVVIAYALGVVLITALFIVSVFTEMRSLP